MALRSISAHDLMRSIFCAACGVHEVKHEGDICDNCKGFQLSLKGGPQKDSLFKERKIEIPEGSKPKRESEPVIGSHRMTVTPHSRPTKKCNWEGCEERVQFRSRGFGAYCTHLQENGKTHRQMKMEQSKVRSVAQPEPEIIEGEYEEVEAGKEIAIIPAGADVRVLELVDHPLHYGGTDDPYEVIKVIEAWGLGFHLGNTVKYIARAGRKPGEDEIQELEKAQWYLQRKIEELKGRRNGVGDAA